MRLVVLCTVCAEALPLPLKHDTEGETKKLRR